MRQDADKRLANNLWRMMGERDMSQTELARESNTSISTLNRVLNGRGQSARLDTLRRWREVLGCTWTELLE